MATLIRTGPNSFIAGDPPGQLPEGHHWCEHCGGSGLEYDYGGELQICFGGFSACTVDCTDTACATHSSLHPMYQAEACNDSARAGNRPTRCSGD